MLVNGGEAGFISLLCKSIEALTVLTGNFHFFSVWVCPRKLGSGLSGMRSESQKMLNDLLGVPYMSTGVLCTQHFADRSPLCQRKCFRGSADSLMETVPRNWHIVSTKVSPAEKARREVFEKYLFLDLRSALCCCAQTAKFLHGYKWSEQIQYIDFLNRAKLPRVLASLSRHSNCHAALQLFLAARPAVSAVYLVLQTKVNYAN